MKANISQIEKYIQDFCREYDENFFNFSIAPNLIVYYRASKEKEQLLKDFLKRYKVKVKSKFKNNILVFEF